MKTNALIRWLMMAMLLLLLAGCATTGQDETRVEERDEGLTAEELEAIDQERRAAEAQGAESRRSLEGAELDEMLDDPSSPISQRTVYFDFDSSDIRADDMDILEAHAAFLTQHPDQRIMVQGHTDERGSPSYNLALSEQRAEAVERVLVINGVSEEQLQVTGYGEENPVELGSNEEAWRLNRRAELVYR